MSKRARTATTGDINPQYLVADVVLPAFNDYAVGTFNLPVARIGGAKNKAVVFEILGVDYYMGVEDMADTTHSLIAFLSTAPARSNGETSTLATFGVDFARQQNIAPVFMHRGFEGVSGGMVINMPYHVDTTDSSGNGILVGTQSLTLTYGDVDSTLVSSCSVHILYRLVEVGIQEYVGMVQSQS